ncbi:MAG: hypothetical protein U0324_10050 [Polyangiales bacterium]
MITARTSIALTLTALCLTALPSIASAQTTLPGNDPQPIPAGSASAQQRIRVGEGTPSGALPPPRSENDAQPPVAAPVLPAGGVVQQAGVGGTTAYGRAGVLELGGNIGFNVASGQTTLSISPTIGWFFADNLQISGIFSYRYANVQGVDAHSLQVLAEPSVHIPFSRTVFGFAGVGLGLSYVDGPGAGFALAPRLGVNIAVGRSGILTPAVNFSYATNDVIQTGNGSLLAVSTSFGANVGYTVMW